jgi:hypothetical protein
VKRRDAEHAIDEERAMTFDQNRRMEILRENAVRYTETALECITREYPVMPWYIETGPGPYPTHRQTHPAFYASFDWHSCVEMHWVIVRLLRLFPVEEPAVKARATLSSLLTPENIATEAAFFGQMPGFERPYGWGWFLTLFHEVATWDDSDARAWAEALQPLADLLVEMFVAWLPGLTYAHRVGVHQNTAFGLTRAYDEAVRRAESGDRRLLDAIVENATRWFANDVDYPAHYEPSGADFLSVGLSEAELMSRVLPAATFPAWLERFLPGLAQSRPDAIFRPAVVSDETDGQVAHLHGLNLSRAWDDVVLAKRLPDGDERIGPMLAAAERHADASLDHVVGDDYMVEHWLAVYAVLLLSE